MLDQSPRVDAEELAFGIRFDMQFPENRSLSFSTACPQSVGTNELRTLLRRMSDASDYLDAVYRLRALKRFRDQQQKELRTSREQGENHITNAQAEWQKRKRAGDFQMTEAQAAQYRNFSTTQERIVLQIKQIDLEIAELEATVRGYDAPPSAANLGPG